MSHLETLIKQAKKQDKKAMQSLIIQFKPLLKRQARQFYLMGLEYDDAYQQAALIFILSIYQYQERPAIPFAGYIKKRIHWGLWSYWRKQKNSLMTD